MAAAVMHRASSATITPRTQFASRQPDFREGSIVEERDRSGQLCGRYRCGALLGKGGFARCFEFVDLETGQSLAAKVIERATLIKTQTLSKLTSEIAIHKRMKHKHIVNFIKTFQDEWFVYILLEKCVNQTLMEVAKTRRRFSLAETQFIMAQSIAAIDYMHRSNVIHRDLKLGNMMLDHDMNVKIGDFGLAAELQYDGERKRTICGTPNYIAPEILEGARGGHSFEVDVWSLGVIMYTLLVGEPPFQTADVRTTYSRIKQCRYEFPRGVDIPENAKALVHRILQSRPDKRPSLFDIRSDPFFRDPVPPTVAPLTLFPESQRRARERDAALLGGALGSARGTGASAAGQLPEREALRTRTNEVAADYGVKPLSMPTSCAPASQQPAVQQQQAGAGQTRRSQSPRTDLLYPMNSARPTGFAHLLPNQGAAAGVVASNEGVAQYLRPRSGSMPSKPAVASHREGPAVGGWCAPVPAPVAAAAAAPSSAPSSRPSSPKPQATAAAAPAPTAAVDEDEHRLFTAAHDELHQSLLGVHAPRAGAEDEACPPPTVWITGYADFSAKYGLAYRTNTGHTGVHYNDSTKMVWEPITNRVEYYARVKEVVNGVAQASDSKSGFIMDTFPEALNKKVTLIKYFKGYIASGAKGRRDGVQVVNCCAQCPANNAPAPALTEPNMVNDMVYVKRWLLTSQAMIFRLSNRTIQVCFLDNTEVILTSESKVVTYTDAQGRRRTMPLAVASAHGGDELASRLKYTKEILCKLINVNGN